MEELIRCSVRDVPDFPKPGILFKDITPLLQQFEIFDAIISAFVKRYRDQHIDVIAAIESRGFIFGAPLARELKASFIPIRKKGKLPYDTVEKSYDLEYGTATIEVHNDAVEKGDRVLIIDDLLATGGTAGAACHLMERLGGKVIECAFVIELLFLNGRKKMKDVPVHSLVKYE